MKRIYKYPLNVLNPTKIKGPIQKFLSVQYQQNTKKVCVWCELDSEKAEEEYFILSYGTGEEIPSNPGLYIGTVQLYSGELVAHYYMRKIINGESEEGLFL